MEQALQRAAESPGQCEAHDQAGRCHAESLAQDQAQQALPVGAEGLTDPELSAPELYRVGQHAVEAEPGEDERGQREEGDDLAGQTGEPETAGHEVLSIVTRAAHVRSGDV